MKYTTFFAVFVAAPDDTVGPRVFFFFFSTTLPINLVASRLTSNPFPHHCSKPTFIFIQLRFHFFFFNFPKLHAQDPSTHHLLSAWAVLHWSFLLALQHILGLVTALELHLLQSGPQLYLCLSRQPSGLQKFDHLNTIILLVRPLSRRAKFVIKNSGG